MFSNLLAEPFLLLGHPGVSASKQMVGSNGGCRLTAALTNLHDVQLLPPELHQILGIAFEMP